MNFAGYLRREVRRKLKNRKLTVRAAGLVFAGIASIGIAYGALRAQNRAGLHSILDEIAAGRKVSPRVSLPPQVGFFDGATALYITPEVGVDPNAPAAILAAAKQVATGFNSNFIPQNFGVLPGTTAVDEIQEAVRPRA